MNEARINVKVGPDGQMPTKAYPSDAGYDLYASEGLMLHPGERQTAHTDVYIALPDGYEAQIRPRSGLAKKHGITVVNSPGTVDARYRGELQIILLNTGNDIMHINKGDRIAQMVIHKLPPVHLALVDFLDTTDRGENGFGSTG